MSAQLDRPWYQAGTVDRSTLRARCYFVDIMYFSQRKFFPVYRTCAGRSDGGPPWELHLHMVAIVLN